MKFPKSNNLVRVQNQISIQMQRPKLVGFLTLVYIDSLQIWIWNFSFNHTDNR